MGEWIPEPLPERAEWITGRPRGTTMDPADRVTLDESVSMAFLVVLESMTPAERVAFILHDVFRYSFAEVAEIVGRTPAASRQLASSARRRINAAQPPATPTAQQAGFVRDFKAAWKPRDIGALIGLLRPRRHRDRRQRRPGQRRAPAAQGRRADRPRLRRFRRAPGLTILERTVNGQPGLVAQQNGITVAVMAFDFAGDRIKHIWVILLPRETPALDDGLTRVSIPPRSAESCCHPATLPSPAGWVTEPRRQRHCQAPARTPAKTHNADTKRDNRDR